MWLLKKILKLLLNQLRQLSVFLSLSTGIFPSKLREAFVSPLLKKPSLDKEMLKIAAKGRTLATFLNHGKSCVHSN